MPFVISLIVSFFVTGSLASVENYYVALLKPNFPTLYVSFFVTSTDTLIVT